MKTVPAGSFKAHCLALMDEVQMKGYSVVITKHGKPVAKLIPVEPQPDDIFGFMRAKGKVVGEIVSPALSSDEWGHLG